MLLQEQFCLSFFRLQANLLKKFTEEITDRCGDPVMRSTVSGAAAMMLNKTLSSSEQYHPENFVPGEKKFALVYREILLQTKFEGLSVGMTFSLLSIMCKLSCTGALYKYSKHSIKVKNVMLVSLNDFTGVGFSLTKYMSYRVEWYT